jgi:hypothetical protein
VPLKTEFDQFGVFRIYKDRPSRQSDEVLAADFACNAPTFDTVHEVAVSVKVEQNLYAPFDNASTYLLVKWWRENGHGSIQALDALVKKVLFHSDFNLDDLADFNANRELNRLVSFSTVGQPDTPSKNGRTIIPVDYRPSDGWRLGQVMLKVPGKWKKNESVPEIVIDKIPYRNPLDIVRSAFRDKEFFNYHLKGFTEVWKPSDNEPEERLYSEVYSSPAYLEMEDEVRMKRLKSQPNIIETVVLPWLWASDSTHLAAFGNASLWPGYLSFGSLSKYIRTKVTSLSLYHMVYFKTVRIGFIIILNPLTTF